MKPRDEISAELLEIAPYLASVDNKETYIAPAGYFINLEESISQRTIAVKTIIPGFPTTTFAPAPAGYFDNFSTSILKKIKDTTGREPASSNENPFSTLPHTRENVYTAPPGYFESFVSAVMAEVRSPGKVVVMQKRSSFAAIAAAAMIAMVLCITALWTGNKTVSSTLTAQTEQGYLPPPGAKDFNNPQQFDKAMAGLSRADIINYLESTGNSEDEAALASAIPEKALPDENAYLLNDNTLQLFLGKANTKDNQN